MLFRALLLLALLTSVNALAQAQEKVRVRPQAINPSAEQRSPGSESKTMIGEPEQEMLARRDIRAAEKDHEENLERAREAAQLSTELRDYYDHNKTFGRTELKKLERLEKLARKIRSEAGGSDGDVTLDDPPSQIEPALTRLAEISDKMRKGVESTPRQVVSASVIERANELLEIIRYIRTFFS